MVPSRDDRGRVATQLRRAFMAAGGGYASDRRAGNGRVPLLDGPPTTSCDPSRHRKAELRRKRSHRSVGRDVPRDGVCALLGLSVEDLAENETQLSGEVEQTLGLLAA